MDWPGAPAAVPPLPDGCSRLLLLEAPLLPRHPLRPSPPGLVGGGLHYQLSHPRRRLYGVHGGQRPGTGGADAGERGPGSAPQSAGELHRPHLRRLHRGGADHGGRRAPPDRVLWRRLRLCPGPGGVARLLPLPGPAGAAGGGPGTGGALHLPGDALAGGVRRAPVPSAPLFPPPGKNNSGKPPSSVVYCSHTN